MSTCWFSSLVHLFAESTMESDCIGEEVYNLSTILAWICGWDVAGGEKSDLREYKLYRRLSDFSREQRDGKFPLWLSKRLISCLPEIFVLIEPCPLPISLLV